MFRLGLLFLLLVTACNTSPYAETSEPSIAHPTFLAIPAMTSPDPDASSELPEYRSPNLRSTWQIQYTGAPDFGLPVDLYNLDLFEIEPEAIAGLHERGLFVMCYFSAGSHEDWRPDADQFSARTLGRELDGWPGERWLDIRLLDELLPVMEARLDLAVEKGCDGVDPDNVDGFSNSTGFPLEYDDQLAYNILLARSAHARGLSIGLKNDLTQIPDLLPWFDWAVNEQCFVFDECDQLLPFIDAGKPVFHIEYELENSSFCVRAREMGFNSIRKRLELDEFVEACR
jgi:hypothetical protein